MINLKDIVILIENQSNIMSILLISGHEILTQNIYINYIVKMHKLKLFLLSVITPLLCIGVSFGAWFSDQYYLLEWISYWSLNSNNNTIKVYDLSAPFCISFYNAVSPNNYNSNFQVRGCAIDQNYWFEQCWVPLNISINFTVSTSSSIYCFDPTTWQSDMPWYTLSSVLFDWSFWNYYLQSVDYNIYSMGSYTPSNCSAIESQLGACKDDLSAMSWSYNTCINTLNDRNWQIWTLSWSLASCNSNLSSCQSDLSACSNSCDTLVSQCQSDKSALQSSLSGCNEDKESLQNYNSSLSNQLNECLSNWWSWSLSLTGCNTFSIFWNQDGSPFSLPITNNLFLPNWLRSIITWWVQSIEQVDKPIYDFASSEDLNSSFNKILLFMFALPMFASWIFILIPMNPLKKCKWS